MIQCQAALLRFDKTDEALRNAEHLGDIRLAVPLFQQIPNDPRGEGRGGNASIRFHSWPFERKRNSNNNNLTSALASASLATSLSIAACFKSSRASLSSSIQRKRRQARSARRKK